MTIIDMLLRPYPTEKAIRYAITTMINDNVPFSFEEINDIFVKVRPQLFSDFDKKYKNGINVFTRYSYLFNETYTNHRDMFIALLYAIKDNHKLNKFGRLISVQTDHSKRHNHRMSIGYKQTDQVWANEELKVYYMLQDYHKFDVTELNISTYQKRKIDEYVSNKFGCGYTKMAIKEFAS